MDAFDAFCQFQRFGPERGFLSPCREFALLTISHLVVMLYSIVLLTRHSFMPRTLGRPPLGSLLYSLSCAVSIVLTICELAIPFGLGTPPAVLIIAYSICLLVWAINAVSHLVVFLRWRHLAFLPFIPSTIPLLIFALISTQRWISFGLTHPKTLLAHSLFIAQIVSAFLPWIILRIDGPRRKEEESEIGPLIYQSAEERSTNWIMTNLSQFFFCWANPLLRKGYRRQLKKVDDVFELTESLDLTSLEAILAQNQYSVEFSFAPLLLWSFGRPFFLLGMLRFIGDILKFASPILLHQLITALQNPISIKIGYLCSALMFLSLFLSSICDFHFNYQIAMLNMRAKTALLLAVYKKLLQIPAYRLTDNFSHGKLINLMCTDVDRIGGFISSFHAFWSMPLNFLIALDLLYREIGWAFLAGLAISILLIPLNKWVASKIGTFSSKMMQMKDARMKLVSELAHSMRTVKLNNWEEFFRDKIATIRTQELAHLRAIKYLDAICVYLWASAPIVITVLMLATYSAILHEQLTAAKVFTTLALINILIMPLNAFPWVLSAIINGLVSKRRFDSFFAIKSIDPTTQQEQIYSKIVGNDDPALIRLEGNSFGWTDDLPATIENVQFIGQKRCLIGIVGPVGSGKSTILMGILGENAMKGAPIQINAELMTNGFAYVGQDVWLREGTVRENILCGRPFNQEKLDEAIWVCALQQDIQVMPAQENYRISGEGKTLSGGQKVRLALARAYYADKPVYLLDDPFASLDQAVGQFVFENYVQNGLRAKGKLVILCTHHEAFLRQADFCIRLGMNGKVEQIGPPSELLANSTQNGNQFSTIKKETDLGHQPMEAAEFVGPADGNEEEKEEGAVKIKVYKSYIAAIGNWMAAMIFLSLLAMQCSKNGSDIWLSGWASESTNQTMEMEGKRDWSYPLNSRPNLSFRLKSDQDDANFYLLIYIFIAAFNSLFTLARAFLFAIGCIWAARRLHDRLLARILNASISWWDRTPCGRVTNRLSSDLAMVDDSLPFQLNIFLASFFSLIGTLLVTIVALPILIPLVFLLFIIYFFIQRYYRQTTVELKRISALTMSPLYTHLAETVSGLISIRAFRIIDSFSGQMRHLLGQNLRAQFSSLACSQWLSVRIQLLGVAIVSAISVASVLDASFWHFASPGLIGLALTYALSLTNVLNSILTTFIETEKELISVERICEYAENVPIEEEGNEHPGKEMADQILCHRIHGQIRFTGVSLRYGPEMPLALRDVSFQIEPGQRVAIIGRTGSGKSSILQALLRAHPIECGKIQLDEMINLNALGLKMARSLFGFVSQNPFLFSGTLAENLRMARAEHQNEHRRNMPSIDNDQIRGIVADIGLAQWMEQFGGLEAEIREGGRNLSSGERQLICLLRLALSRSKIILIDEATAHMDEQNQLLMDRLIGAMGCTVLAILHQLAGLEHYDWVIEMSNGQIARQGPPEMFKTLKNNNDVEK